ncbi:MAG: hypothetical protein RLZZ214_1125, partial [Verrucomicrobiota bacterium]
FLDISVAKALEVKLHDIQVGLKTRLAGESAKLDKARGDLKAERQRAGKGDGQSPGTA